MEFTPEELILIKDVMNVWGGVDESKSNLAEKIWNKLDDAKVLDVDIYDDSAECKLEEYFEENSDDCDDSCDTYTYDCQDMPDDVRSEFFDGHHAGNDCHVTHYVQEGTLVGDFLIDELDCEHEDEVIVKHWW